MNPYKLFVKFEMPSKLGRVKATDSYLIWADSAQIAVETMLYQLPEDAEHVRITQIWKDTGKRWERVEMDV